MDCSDNEDLILLDAAGVLEADESAELRRHLDTGCPQCWGYRAAAEATLAQLWLGLEHSSPPPAIRKRLMDRIANEALVSERSAPRRRGDWERIVLPAAIAALLAVAITLLAVRHFTPPRPAGGPDQRDIELVLLRRVLHDTQARLQGMQFAQLTGAAQPDAVGRVFIDGRNGKWYFFSTGMKPAGHGKTYELWVISDQKKIPEGTFEVSGKGTAMLLGAVPTLPPGAGVSLAVTDEPAGGTQSPTGRPQIVGQVQ